MIATRNTLKEKRWPQTKSPIQIDNSSVSGVVNNNIVPRKIKTMERLLHWLRCREDHCQLRYYWASGSLNWGDYSTKHHPPLYHITAQEMIATRNTLKEKRWPQTKSPIQIDNSSVSGVVNNNIVPRKIKTMERLLHWLRCREDHCQLRYYWASGSLNWGDYSTKHHPPLYHKSKIMQCSRNIASI